MIRNFWQEQERKLDIVVFFRGMISEDELYDRLIK